MCEYLLPLFPSMIVFSRTFTYATRVIGLSDGLTVPFALTAGLSSLGESRLVVLGGTAELIAGAISMGIGGFLASQAERDHYKFLKHATSSRVVRSCDGEIEREVYAILGPVGVDERTSGAVTKCLRDVECNTGINQNNSSSSSSDEETQSLRWKSDVGLTPFLLKFGEGLSLYLFLLSCIRFTDFVLLDRGSADQSSIRVGDYNWARVPRWRDHTSHTLPFRLPRSRGLDLFLHSDWFRTSGLRSCQSQGYWRRQRSQGVCVGCDQYITCWWSGCGCSIHHRCVH